MHSSPNRSPVLSVVGLAALLIGTVNLFSFYWFYRTAAELRARRGLPLTPWHWGLVPLLGPFMVFPVTRMASYLKDWQIEDDRPIAHFAEPVLVATIVFSAFLPLLMLVIEPGALITVAVTVALLLMIAPLALQGQLRLNEDREPARPGMAKWQLATVIVGAIGAIPLYVFAYTNVFEMRGSRQLEAGTVATHDSGLFQVRTSDAAWTQVRNGLLSDESALEFVGRDDYTYAIVFDLSGFDADGIIAYRIEAALDEFHQPDCTQRKTLLPGTLIVEGFVECKGRSPIQGEYVFLARSLVSADKAVEMIASTSQFDAASLRSRRQDLDAILAGLELIE